jgi:maltooligosyltrehalose trehalohydrolase
VPAARIRAIVGIYILLPQIPMIFMGEEFGASQPFPFFCDFEPGLAKLVREGRRAEFARFPEFEDPAKRERIPDPTAEDTFISAKLDWKCVSQGVHAEWVSLYQELLEIRDREIVPRLKGALSGCYEVLGEGAVTVRWRMGDGAKLCLIANLTDKPLECMINRTDQRLWRAGAEDRGSLAAWDVLWSIDK